jgi:hypothetical protein
MKGRHRQPPRFELSQRHFSLSGGNGRQDQLATVALAARYHSVASVTIGTTTGMMLMDYLRFLGEKLAGGSLMKWIAGCGGTLRVVRYRIADRRLESHLKSCWNDPIVFCFADRIGSLALTGGKLEDFTARAMGVCFFL